MARAYSDHRQSLAIFKMFEVTHDNAVGTFFLRSFLGISFILFSNIFLYTYIIYFHFA